MHTRIGLGFDSHEFEEGKPLFLGGVRIDFPKGLKGHSDGDVLLHALTDAILGAIGEPDIGELFSDKDERWKGVSSELFLKEAIKRMKGKGYELINLDSVLIANEPKIAPYKETIKEKLSKLTGLPVERISIKGKRREGFCQVEGIACICTVLLRVPYEG
ncbi:2-C-methyl-D-erythritol 2,4-cyclodiphosphate synthase [Hydrogenivirga caldilitoris]|uniref:2-C-methyl-D-erythritol 2,4-cyclodiphosphate synthase n=1 Tax=Hydrogenivirga caldilitoris TaxID=246264 RepID=A0A497XQQ7_9AQUI|nr:2-C-methyl-D-erythritol 2,4-cyclodiphosphate synthase [Hydrogenivirga caldilitoris]RLJ70490.1 2-C-methyl-D-erythritol 2,4-cyclodiphosphate synthase [Hydrogenivirga caldilitoris]